MKLDAISKSFDGAQVLDAVTIDVNQPTALLGENGAGKTTLLRIAAGLLRPNAGFVEAVPFAYVPQDAPVYPELTAAEHAVWWAKIHDAQPADLAEAGLPNPAAKAGDLSRGQRQRLHLAMALATPGVLLLDEPFTALDAAGRTWLEQELAARGGPMLMSLHDEALASRLCSQVVRL